MDRIASQIQGQLAALKVLVVDDERMMRKVTRSLLQAIGVNSIYEADSSRSGVEAICTLAPDMVILDWEMPGGPNGAEFVRQVRSPANFPYPDLPIIMLTAFADRARVVEAVKLGVNEFLLKPVSSKMLLSRLVSVLNSPRHMVKKGNHYVPAPRGTSAFKAEPDPRLSKFELVD